MNNAPCYDCPKREPHCHSTCPEYKQFRARVETVRQNRDAECKKDARDFLFDGLYMKKKRSNLRNIKW